MKWTKRTSVGANKYAEESASQASCTRARLCKSHCCSSVRWRQTIVVLGCRRRAEKRNGHHGVGDEEGARAWTSTADETRPRSYRGSADSSAQNPTLVCNKGNRGDQCSCTCRCEAVL